MLILLKGHRRFLYYSSKPRANQHTSQLEYLYLFFCGGEGNRRIKGIVTLAHMLLCVLARLKLKRILKLQKCYDKLTDPTWISIPSVFKINADRTLSKCRSPLTEAVLWAAISSGMLHFTFEDLQRKPKSALWRGHIVNDKWDSSTANTPKQR